MQFFSFALSFLQTQNLKGNKDVRKWKRRMFRLEFVYISCLISWCLSPRLSRAAPSDLSETHRQEQRTFYADPQTHTYSHCTLPCINRRYKSASLHTCTRISICLENKKVPNYISKCSKYVQRTKTMISSKTSSFTECWGKKFFLIERASTKQQRWGGKQEGLISITYVCRYVFEIRVKPCSHSTESALCCQPTAVIRLMLGPFL